MEEKKLKHLRHHNIAGQYRFLTFSCYHGYPLLAKERTCVWLMEAIERAAAKHEFRLEAYVFMPNHAHLLVLPENENHDMGRFLQVIKQPVAMRAKAWLRHNDPVWFDKLTTVDSAGASRFHFWQRSGGFDRNIFKAKTFTFIVDYIHENPVRRRLVDSANDWRWSSARWFASGKEGRIFNMM